MEIVQIRHDLPSAGKNELIEFARTCSWRGTGRYFAELLEDGEFEESEKIFAAVEAGTIVGFGALVKESCVEDVDFSPWLDFLFVDENHRNRGIAGKLMEYILQAAQEENADSVYLCTVSHEKMYEKHGFQTLFKTVINGGDECKVMKRQMTRL